MDPITHPSIYLCFGIVKKNVSYVKKARDWQIEKEEKDSYKHLLKNIAYINTFYNLIFP